MSLFTALLTGGWHWIAVIGALIAALGASYFGGKKIGKVQQQAKADTESAKKEAAQTAAVAHQQQLHREEATRVTTDNSNLGDAAARDKLQQSKYNKP